MAAFLAAKSENRVLANNIGGCLLSRTDLRTGCTQGMVYLIMCFRCIAVSVKKLQGFFVCCLLFMYNDEVVVICV